MTTRRLSSPQSRRGAVAVQATLLMVPILGVLALTLDGGVLLSRKRIGQATADAAALSAAVDMFNNTVSDGPDKGLDYKGSAKQAAYAVALANGYAQKSDDSEVEVHIPPTTGPFQGKRWYVEVITTWKQPRIFSAIAQVGNDANNDGRDNIVARAVAVGRWERSNVGILVLNPSVKGALTSSGNGNSFVQNAAVVVNSNHSEAAITSGGGLLAAKEFNITGGYSGVGFNGPIYTGVEPTPDPLAYLPEPDPSTMTAQTTPPNINEGTEESPYILYPGVYSKSINIGSQAVVVMMPGIYYLEGGFKISGGASVVGEGVMLFNVGARTNQDINITGGDKLIKITPPTSGIYAGLTIFQRRTSTVPVSVAGGANTIITGTFYAAGALMKISGGSDSNIIGWQYISDTLTLTGNGNLDIRYREDEVPKIREIYLVE